MTSRAHRRPLVVLAVLIGASLAVPTTAGASGGGIPVTREGQDGQDGQSGAAAIRLLGTRLPDVAAKVGWTEPRLRSELARDPALRVASAGSLYYVDAVETPTATGTSDADSSDPDIAAAGLPPLADTFLLHSRPGAPRTVYLDTNGHTTSATTWNTICDQVICRVDPLHSAAFDIDGAPESFSDTELQLIQGIWSRVADDFAMFDIDITTQAPATADLLRSNPADQRYGVRVVLTSSNFYSPALGVALIGSFGRSVDTPAFVFSRISGSSYAVPYGLAQGVSHEVGHTLGLSHDGSTNPPASYSFGTSAWGPIMGGAGVARYVTWSKGEYAFASNQEDDLAVMQSLGAAWIPDIVGDTPVGAQTLEVSSGAFSASGRIETRTDKDVFAFDADGHVAVSVSPAAMYEPNLDLEVVLLNAAGTVIAGSNACGGGTRSLSLDLAAGRYYLSVDGLGKGDPALPGQYSDYASLGTYDIAGTVGPSAPGGPGSPPVAAGTASSLDAALTVAFSSAGSSDPESQPLRYSWTFGDGTTSCEANPTHRYPRPGTYVATLAVQDVGGQQTSLSIPVVVADPSAKITVSTVTGLRVRKGTVKVTLKVVDGNGVPVRSALVKGRWTGSLATKSAYTNSQGLVTFVRSTSKTATFTTTKVSRTKKTWDGVNRSISVSAV